VVDITWGALAPGVLDRIVVVQPHFDDAALGAAYVLAEHPGSAVVTVCAGKPDAYPDPPSDWDALGGFTGADDIVAIRRDEDLAALAILEAEPVWLDFVDHQYLTPETMAARQTVADALEGAINEQEPTAVFLPMGLANPDHALTHDAGMLLAASRGDITWFCYEDGGYKHIPGMLAWRIAKLFRSDLWPTPAIVPATPDAERKRAAITAYTSQLAPLDQGHALEERLSANVPEQHWILQPPPPGWERMRDL
jgi:LmbE family N-acetylglucosaminyl deacetylase